MDLSSIFLQFTAKVAKNFAQPVYEFEEFHLDAEYSMLYRDGNEVPLPPKAIETLRALIEKRGEIEAKTITDALLR